jgi:hypothetical protein
MSRPLFSVEEAGAVAAVCAVRPLTAPSPSLTPPPSPLPHDPIQQWRTAGDARRRLRRPSAPWRPSLRRGSRGLQTTFGSLPASRRCCWPGKEVQRSRLPRTQLLHRHLRRPGSRPGLPRLAQPPCDG